MNTIEIKNTKGEVLFKHTAENNTVLHTLETAVRNLAELRGSDFTEADLSGGDFRGIKLIFVNLIRADLTFADCRGADCRGADLMEADLAGADLRGTDLRGATYTQEQIDLAITDETTIF